MSSIGHAQLRNRAEGRALITSADDLLRMKSFLGPRSSFPAADLVDYLLGAAGPGRS